MKCDVQCGRGDILGYYLDAMSEGAPSSLECMRSQGHDGSHLVQRFDGTYIAWEKDWCHPGTCIGCDSEDSEDDCLCYREIHSAVEVQQYLHDKTYEGGKDEQPKEI